YSDSDRLPPIRDMFMSDHYRHARTIPRAREQIIARAPPRVGRKRPREEDLGNGLRTFDGQITVADPGELATDPALPFPLYATSISRSLPVLPFARDAIARLARDPAFGSALRANREASTLFVQLVSTAQETCLR